mmetsp:Transcript_2454/g.6562  ORF Transcript_2454/g.6562 Transcript_2454/m.6562 type:complete len:242 (+) Transcript_2454:390-1115(+)
MTPPFAAWNSSRTSPHGKVRPRGREKGGVSPNTQSTDLMRVSSFRVHSLDAINSSQLSCSIFGGTSPPLGAEFGEMFSLPPSCFRNAWATADATESTVNSGYSSRKLHTFERTLSVPFDLIAARFGDVILSCNRSKSECTSMVPWWYAFFPAILNAAPDIFFPCSSTSKRSFARAGMPRPSVSADARMAVVVCLLKTAAGEMKEKLRLPGSWKTVPPPLLRRARDVRSAVMRAMLHSFQGF